jgi:hypothetical protein
MVMNDNFKKVILFICLIVLHTGMILTLGCDSGDDNDEDLNSDRLFSKVIGTKYLNNLETTTGILYEIVSTEGDVFQVDSDTIVKVQRSSCSGFNTEGLPTWSNLASGSTKTVYYYMDDVDFGANPTTYKCSQVDVWNDEYGCVPDYDAEVSVVECVTCTTNTCTSCSD